ncbi:uncharacterized protein EV422DRAFT_397537 [Fimicolochytrium jonesii]|uniref:uncharacterized protein n=1 Tax=Fimicolochytrium jonesii TaxID=1396493 RepID=UPI0022FEC829|nr:uncharacterized protein EV422DRAFT_397537 [Fimicolochytrium jonesii]KAI8822410.1 hypothetical protein EV422DRAFT_397537 [Fimicolochytrium jonesii]
MGVKGLASYIQQLPTSAALSVKFAPGDTEEASVPVLVDGHSFVYHVAKEISWLHGARHEVFARAVVRQAEQLGQVGLQLAFIFDGILPKQKFDERLSRSLEKVGRVAGVMDEILRSGSAASGPSRGGPATLFPPMAIPACICALRRSGFRLMVCPEGEADIAIANMARQLRAPVMSRDTDFLIHCIEDRGVPEDAGPSLQGYIPLDSLTWEGSILHARLYTKETFAAALGISSSMLPLFAVLTGCDYISHHDRRALPGSLEILSQKGLGNLRIKKIIKLLQGHAGSPTPEAALNDIVDYLKPGEAKDDLLAALQHAMKQYLTHESENLSRNNSGVIFDLFTQGLYEPRLGEIANGRVFWNTPFLEDNNRGSAWDIARDIRIWVYGAVAVSCASPVAVENWGLFEVDSSLYDDFVAGRLHIRENIRRADRLVMENVTAVSVRTFLAAIEGLGPAETPRPTKLPGLGHMTDAQRDLLFMRILDSDYSAMRDLEPTYIPLAVASRYLVRELHSRGQSLPNYELSAILCAGIKAIWRAGNDASYVSEAYDVRHDFRPTRLSVHRQAQMECSLYCVLLLGQSLLTGVTREAGQSSQDLLTSHWTCLDGFEFHRCMELAKGGAPPERMLSVDSSSGDSSSKETSASLLASYRRVHSAVLEGIDDQVEMVIDYGDPARRSTPTPKKKAKKKTMAKRTPVQKKNGLTSNNLFEALSSGCTF